MRGQIDMSKQITIDVFKKALPKHVQGNLTQAMVDTVNGMLLGDSQESEHFRDDLLGHTSVMKDGRFTIQQYINAVRYVSFKMQDCSNEQAYSKTFPERYQKLLDQGLDSRKIGGYVSQWNSRILVQKIFEQSMIPVHIYNREVYQKAINVQMDIMMSANSEMARTQAANSLLTHLKPPEAAKVELDINVNEGKVIDELKSTIAELSAVQKKQIEMGLSTVKQVAHSKLNIIDAEEVN